MTGRSCSTMAVRRSVALLMCAVIVTSANGCGLIDDPTSPSTTTPPTETFTGTLAPKGSRIFNFAVVHAGQVSVTLRALSPSDVSVGLGLGTPTGTTGTTECTLTTSTPDTTAGSTAQITATVSSGSFCVKIYDNGNVRAPSTFTIDIIHS